MENFINKVKDITLFDDYKNQKSQISDLIDRLNKDKKQTCIILDDLMTSQDEFMVNLFTSGRHKNCSIFELTQRIFTGNKASRTQRLNTNYFVLFNFGDKQEAKSLLQKIEPVKWKQVLEMYEDCIEKRFGCLIIDLKCNEIDADKDIKKLLKYRHTDIDNCFTV